MQSNAQKQRRSGEPTTPEVFLGGGVKTTAQQAAALGRATVNKLTVAQEEEKRRQQAEVERQALRNRRGYCSC